MGEVLHALAEADGGAGSVGSAKEAESGTETKTEKERQWAVNKTVCYAAKTETESERE